MNKIKDNELNKFKNIISDQYISIANALKKISLGGKKCIIVVNKKKTLLGTLSDGDIRNAIIKGIKLEESIKNIYQKKPFVVYENNFAPHKIRKIFIKHHYDLIPKINQKKQLIDIIFWEDYFANEKKINYKKLDSEVIIMAGGKGKRLSPITEIIPKPLIPLNGIPLIQQVIESFLKYKINKFHISLNYKNSIIKAFFKDLNPKYKINYISENKPLGTIGAVKKLENIIKKPFILINCDVIVEVDYVELKKFHIQNKNHITIVVATKEYKMPYGNCIVDKSGNIKKIEEKPIFNFLANSGVYFINNDLIKNIPANKYYNIDQFINKVIKDKLKIGIYPISSEKWKDVGKWPDFIDASA